jgi:hypothetical protein
MNVPNVRYIPSHPFFAELGVPTMCEIGGIDGPNVLTIHDFCSLMSQYWPEDGIEYVRLVHEAKTRLTSLDNILDKARRYRLPTNRTWGASRSRFRTYDPDQTMWTPIASVTEIGYYESTYGTQLYPDCSGALYSVPQLVLDIADYAMRRSNVCLAALLLGTIIDDASKVLAPTHAELVQRLNSSQEALSRYDNWAVKRFRIPTKLILRG